MTAAPGGLLRIGGAGRGAWLCRGSSACLERASRRRVFGHALRTRVADEAAGELRLLLEEADVVRRGPPDGRREQTAGRRGVAREDGTPGREAGARHEN